MTTLIFYVIITKLLLIIALIINHKSIHRVDKKVEDLKEYNKLEHDSTDNVIVRKQIATMKEIDLARKDYSNLFSTLKNQIDFHYRKINGMTETENRLFLEVKELQKEVKEMKAQARKRSVQINDRVDGLFQLNLTDHKEMAQALNKLFELHEVNSESIQAINLIFDSAKDRINLHNDLLNDCVGVINDHTIQLTTVIDIIRDGSEEVINPNGEDTEFGENVDRAIGEMTEKVA